MYGNGEGKNVKTDSEFIFIALIKYWLSPQFNLSFSMCVYVDLHRTLVNGITTQQ